MANFFFFFLNLAEISLNEVMMSTQVIVIEAEVFPLNGNSALIIRNCLFFLSGI